MNAFNVLNAINCNEHTEKKNGLTYLSWAWAWAEIKKRYPESYYTVYENKDGLFYHTDGKTCWVKTGVTLVENGECLQHIEYLPVMDFRNRSIPVDQVTSVDVNKTIQRSLTKACARHGLGLYIYAGEDLPEEEYKPEPLIDMPEKPHHVAVNLAGDRVYVCEDCGAEIKDVIKNGKTITVQSQIDLGGKYAHKIVCPDCLKPYYEAQKGA